jgi:tetratricopeptide (TPR) repeat protein
MPQNSSVIEKCLRWAIERRQTLASVGLTALVGLLIISAILYQKHNLQQQNWNMLSYAENQIMQGQTAQAANTLNVLVGKSHSAPILAQAYQLLGSLAVMAGNAQQGAAMFQEGIVHASNPNNRSLLLMSLGTAYEDAGDLRKADDTYNQFLAEFPEHYLTPRILFSAIRAETLNNNPIAAREHYEKLLTSYANSSWTVRAGTLLENKTTPEKQKLP